MKSRQSVGCCALVAALVAGAFYSCRTAETAQIKAGKDYEPMSRYRWVSNLYEKLTLDRTRFDDLVFFELDDANLSDAEIVDRLMKDPNFEFYTLDLSLAHLGRLSSALRSSLLAGNLSTIQSYPHSLLLSQGILGNVPFHEFTSYRPYGFRVDASEDGKLEVVPSKERRSWFTHIKEEIETSQANLHRARAAYVLSTFFCDRLEQVVLPLIEEQKETMSIHASAGCQSCHYKLDPIGAYFFLSSNLDEELLTGDSPAFSFPEGRVTFESEDGKEILGSYTHRTGNFEAGYFRTAEPDTDDGIFSVKIDKPSGNYLNDKEWQRQAAQKLATVDPDEIERHLAKTMSRAPEVARCLARRTVEHALGQEQVYSHTWLNSLSQDFVDAWQSGDEKTGQQFRSFVKSVYLSRAFRAKRRDRDTCYDPEGMEKDPLCPVDYLLKEYCMSCHNDDSSWVDFSRRQKSSDGHLIYWTNKEIAADRFYQKIYQSVSSNDPEERMPYQQEMPDVDRQRLLTFLKSKL